MQIFGGWKVEREGEGGNTNFLFYLHMSKKSCTFAAEMGFNPENSRLYLHI